MTGIDTTTEGDVSIAGVSRQRFLGAMRAAASPVCVVTTGGAGARVGITVSSFVSVSADPPLVSVCINRRSPVCRAVSAAGGYAVHALAEGQEHVAETFAGRPRRGAPYDFTCAAWVERGEGKESFLAAAAFALECLVVQEIDASSHLVFIGRVVDMAAGPGSPLIYWRGAYAVPAHPSGVRA